MSDMVRTQEYTDTATGTRLEVEYDIPEHPKYTVFPPEDTTIELDEFNEAVKRLMTSAMTTLEDEKKP